MINAVISPEFAAAAQEGYQAIVIEADVVNDATPEQLSEEIDRLAESMKQVMEVADINKRPAIAATRAAYKRFGKDPNRYRPSQEQMSRRLLKGLGLYTVNALVDAGNLLSLKSGCSIGVFDREKIQGDTLTWGIGQADEPYVGIGRGPINVEGLPLIRDAVGGIGSPTSDNERTAVDLATRHIVVTVHCFGTEMTPDEIIAEASRLFTTYASASNYSARVIKY